MSESAETNRKRQWAWTVQKEAVALRLWEGKTYDEIIKEFGISSKTIAAWKKEPEFDARIDDLDAAATAETKRILRRAGPGAAKTIVELSVWGLPGHSTRLAAAKDVLDRLGLKAPEKHEHTINPATAAQITDDELDAEMKKRGLA